MEGNDGKVRQLQDKLFQKDRLLLSSRAGLAAVIVEHFGKEAEELICEQLNNGTRKWAAEGARADKMAGGENDIQGLIRFLWEPLRDEGFEFTYAWQEDGCQFTVTRCPIAEIAKSLKLDKWGFVFHCMGDKAICEGYNPRMQFRRTKTIMDGDDYCDHFYSLPPR